MIIRPATVGAALAAILVPTPDLTAQTPLEPVPRDLAVILLGDASAPLRVGELPQDSSRDIPLPPGRIVGSVERPWGSSIVVEMEGTAVDGLAAYREALTESGYQEPSRHPMRGGFQDSGGPPMAGLCGDDRYVTPWPSTFAGSAYMRVDVQERRRSICDADADPRRIVPVGATLIPSLLPPSDTRVRGQGTGHSDDHSVTQAMLTTDMPADAVAAAYADQLEAAGWSLAGRMEDDGASVSRWTIQGPEGEAWTGFLAVWAVAEGRLTAIARVERPTSPP